MRRLPVFQQLFAVKESRARPIDELSQIFLRIHQRVVVFDEVCQELLPPLEASCLIFIRQPLGKKRVSFVLA
jgi:hypothetical protein